MLRGRESDPLNLIMGNACVGKRDHGFPDGPAFRAVFYLQERDINGNTNAVGKTGNYY